MLLSNSLVDVLDLTGLSPSDVVFFPYGFCTLFVVVGGGDDLEGDSLDELYVEDR